MNEQTYAELRQCLEHTVVPDDDVYSSLRHRLEARQRMSLNHASELRTAKHDDSADSKSAQNAFLNTTALQQLRSDTETSVEHYLRNLNFPTSAGLLQPRRVDSRCETFTQDTDMSPLSSSSEDPSARTLETDTDAASEVARPRPGGGGDRVARESGEFEASSQREEASAFLFAGVPALVFSGKSAVTCLSCRPTDDSPATHSDGLPWTSGREEASSGSVVAAVGTAAGELLLLSLTRQGSEAASPITLGSHRDAITDICWTDDGRCFLCVSLDSFIGVWDADRKEKIREIATNYPALSAKFLPKNNNLCIVGSATPGVRVFNLSTGNLVKRVKTADSVVSIATDDSGRFVFTAGRDGSLAAFAVHQGGGTVRKVASLNLGSSRGVSFIAWQEGKFEEDHPRSEAVAAAWSISGSSSMLTDFIAASVRGAVLLVTFVHSRKYPEIAGSRAESRDGLNVHQLAVMRSIPIPQASMPLRCTFCERPSTAANLCVATGSEDGCVHLVSGNMYRSDISVTLSPGYPCVIVDVAWNASQTILLAGTDTGDVVVWRRLRISGGDAVDAEFQRTVVADHPPQPASSSGSQTDVTAVTEQSDHPESSAFTLSAATDLS